MIVCYARGGGLGHLTRMRAYLHTVHPGAEAVILTEPPAPGMLEGAAEFVVDAFPAGLEGELSAFHVPAGVAVVHLARLLRWEAYRPLIPDDAPRFDRTWLVEPITDPHLTYLREISGAVTPLHLVDPPAPAATAPADWLVVHSGPDRETLELVDYARECAALEGATPSLALISPAAPDGLPPDVRHVAINPAWPLFATADRIVSAAGFNTVRQAAPHRDRHRVLPFPRRFDDQFTRAARLRARQGRT